MPAKHHAGEVSPEALSQAGAGSRHVTRRRRAPRWVKWLSGVLAIVLVAGLCSGAALYLHLQNNIRTEDLNAALDPQSAKVADDNHDPLQVLIMGTDTRSGSDAKYGTDEDFSGYGNSDVMILMNLSADRNRVTMVSFPRDMEVPFPGCKDPKTGTVYPAQPSVQLNSALSMAGPGCTVAAINNFTGLQIDHFMMADFHAVTQLSDAVGGVDVCVTKAVNDPASGLNLPAGTSSVKGEQALSFLRTRHAFGDASDLSRIRAQQSFLASLARKIKSENTLTNLPKLYNIADIITQNLTVDKGLANPSALVTFAGRLKDVDLSKVAFVTAPTAPSPNDPNRVVLAQPQADELFKLIRADGDVTAKPGAAASNDGGNKAPSPSSAPLDKASVPVSVQNVSGATGRGAELAQALGQAGYSQAGADSSASGQEPSTQLLFDASSAAAAHDIAAQLGLPDSALVPAANVTGVQLVVGADFASGMKYQTAAAPDGIQAKTADAPAQCQQVNDLPR